MPGSVEVGQAGGGRGNDGIPSVATRMAPLRFASAQLIVATGAATALELMAQGRASSSVESTDVPPIAWVPAILAPLAAVSAMIHATSPTDRSAGALRFFNSAAVVVGGTLLVSDMASSGKLSIRRLGALGLVAAGVMGYALDRHEQESENAERALRRRAAIVERLVPRRKAKLDRVVVHV